MLSIVRTHSVLSHTVQVLMLHCWWMIEDSLPAIHLKTLPGNPLLC